MLHFLRLTERRAHAAKYYALRVLLSLRERIEVRANDGEKQKKPGGK
jgi:hypothetical protein